MASKRFYSYYVKGNQIALAEQDAGGGVCSLSGYSNETTCVAAGGTWTDNAIGNNYGEWRSPVASVADGLEIQYTYVPNYNINQTNLTHTTITHYRTNAGYLQIKGGSVNYDDTTDVDGYIVLENAGKFNGLHKITSYDNVDATKDAITLSTKYSGSTSWSTFEETVTLFYRVDAMVDESFDLDLPRYQALAVAHYVKAKMLEDAGDIKGSQFYMREFKMQLEKSKSAFQKGPHRMSGFMNRL
jgi:hypothetical protein